MVQLQAENDALRLELNASLSREQQMQGQLRALEQHLYEQVRSRHRCMPSESVSRTQAKIGSHIRSRRIVI